MRLFAATSLLAIALAAPAPVRAQDVPAATPTPSPTPFRLPTRPTPTPSDVQGPVDPDAPILTRPRDPTPTPTPRATAAPAPTPTARPAPTPAPRSTRAPNSTLPPRFTPPAAPTPQESAAATADAADRFPSAPTDVGAPPAAPLPIPSASAGPSPATATAEGDSGWLYALLGLLALGAAGAAVWWRRRTVAEAAPATIEPPKVAPPKPVSSDPAPSAPTPAAISGAPLLIEAKAIKLARSMMFASLSYEIAVTNRTGQPMEKLRFGGDLVTAHARVPAEQQLADPAMPLAPMQEISRLDPGQTAQLKGELRLPVKDIRPIPHGSAVVYVPLLRVRAEAEGLDPVARTFVVGLLPGGIGQKLQPFRLDEMPQTYSAVGQRALD